MVCRQTMGPVTRHPQSSWPVRHRSPRTHQSLVWAANPLPQKLHRRRQDPYSAQFPCWRRRRVSDRLACQIRRHCCRQRRDHSIDRHRPILRRYLADRLPRLLVAVPAQTSPGIAPTAFAVPRRRKRAYSFPDPHYRPAGCRTTSLSPLLMVQTSLGHPLPVHQTATGPRDRLHRSRLQRRDHPLFRHPSSRCLSRHRTSFPQRNRPMCPLQIRTPWRPDHSFQTHRQVFLPVPFHAVADPAALCPAADVHQFPPVWPAAQYRTATSRFATDFPVAGYYQLRQCDNAQRHLPAVPAVPGETPTGRTRTSSVRSGWHQTAAQNFVVLR